MDLCLAVTMCCVVSGTVQFDCIQDMHNRHSCYFTQITKHVLIISHSFIYSVYIYPVSFIGHETVLGTIREHKSLKHQELNQNTREVSYVLFFKLCRNDPHLHPITGPTPPKLCVLLRGLYQNFGRGRGALKHTLKNLPICF